MNAIQKSLLIFLGAGIGANGRYWLGQVLTAKLGTAFPWATMLVNISGSLLIGVAMGFLLPHPASNPWRLLVVVGILGGYTTFSTFSFETVQLIQLRNYGPAFAYVVSSCVLSIAGTWLGLIAARAITRG